MTAVVRLNDRNFYAVPMRADAHRALGWIGDRYDSAAVLFDHARWVRNVLLVSEPVAWDYLQALSEEDGAPALPPCAGGALATALVDLYDSIV